MKNFIIVAVSDDYSSSLRTLNLSRNYENIIPCIGIHPWIAHEVSIDEVNQVINLINRSECICVGEVGLDTIFRKETIERQREIFQKFLEVAKELDLVMNIHAAGTWSEVFELLRKYDIKRVIFHWYTGPINLINDIVSSGYYISINPAIKIQEKHRKIVEYVPTTHLLTESDGPYTYRGMELEPSLIPETIKIIANIKKMSIDVLTSIIHENFRRLFK